MGFPFGFVWLTIFVLFAVVCPSWLRIHLISLVGSLSSVLHPLVMVTTDSRFRTGLRTALAMLKSDAAALMAPPLDPSKAAALMKNPWASEMVSKDIELLKLEKRKREEEESVDPILPVEDSDGVPGNRRYQKVASLLQSMLGLLLCAVDMRLGIGQSLSSLTLVPKQHAVCLFSHPLPLNLACIHVSAS